MMKTFIVVGYYTKAYRNSAFDFVRSAVEHGVPVYCEYVEDRGSWNLNTSYKPTFLMSCMERFTCDIVYCDVDARFAEYPKLFESITKDIAFYKGPVWNGSKEEVLSGTVFLKNNKIVKNFLCNWSNNCNNNNAWDQTLIEPSLPDGISVEPLPIEYCAIFDSPRIEGKNVVIRHMQHSRTLKR